MNKIHRIVWSAVRGAFVVAHEMANSHGKPSSTQHASRQPNSFPFKGKAGMGMGQIRPIALALAVCLATAVLPAPTFAAPPVNALPTGGQIVGGATAGTISTAGSAMTIQQNQQRMIANWESFSIGSAASVHFTQPVL